MRLRGFAGISALGELRRAAGGLEAVLFISHRLSSTQFCDRVVYLENGRVAEEGTHRELLERGGKYAELFEIQSSYYKDKTDQEEPS